MELSDNQVELVLHAMKFPAVVAVVYSTCSIYQIENEKAVRRILRSQSRFRLVKALPWWQRRGQVLDDDGGADDDDAAGTGGDSGGDSGSDDVQEIARCVVRSAYPDDRTIGFFLARFERADATESHTSAQGGTAAGSASDLEFKLNALARARAKEQKEAAQRSKEAEQRKPAGGGSEAEKAGGSSSRPIPQWRLERDANKKKGSGSESRRTQSEIALISHRSTRALLCPGWSSIWLSASRTQPAMGCDVLSTRTVQLAVHSYSRMYGFHTRYCTAVDLGALHEGVGSAFGVCGKIKASLLTLCGKRSAFSSWLVRAQRDLDLDVRLHAVGHLCDPCGVPISDPWLTPHTASSASRRRSTALDRTSNAQSGPGCRSPRFRCFRSPPCARHVARTKTMSS